MSTITITVNGKEERVASNTLSYDSVVGLSGMEERPDYTVTYRKGVQLAQGTISKGSWVNVAHGMVFNVALTDGA